MQTTEKIQTTSAGRTAATRPRLPILFQKLALTAGLALLLLLLVRLTNAPGSPDYALAQSGPWQDVHLKVALSGPYEPFTIIDKSGGVESFSGFDAEIARALCEDLGSQCTFANVPFDAVIPALVREEFDFAVAGLALTAEREKLVDFTERYFRSHSVFLAKAEGAGELKKEDLAGKKIGTQQGSLQAAYLEANYPDSTLVLQSSFHGLIRALEAGDIDAALVEGHPAYTYLKTPEGAKLAILGPPLRAGELNDEGCVVVAKKNVGLRDRLNQAIENIRLNGTYDKINRKYFDFTIY